MATSQRSRPKKVVGYGDFIDGQVEKTRRQVKVNEVAGGLVTLFVGVFLFLIAAIVIDHWVMPLRSLGRWGMLSLLVGGVGGFLFLRLIPMLFRRVNPVYAAKTIEQHSGGMKNTLVNHLLLRDTGKGTSKRVLQAVEQQAAQRLSQTRGETAVDRGRVIRLGYLLIVLMAVLAFYKFFSPKDPMSTIGRITAPWAGIAAPTRVSIERVTPGKDTWVYADEKPVEIEAVVRGLRRGEPVTIYWSTDDGRVENQAIEMQPLSGDGRSFRGYLPEQNAGLRQDVRYFVAAGDAKSEVFRVEVRTAPTITVKAIEYRYPRYTRLGRRVQRDEGDITAVEGTEVTIRAEANQPIKSGMLDINCDSTIDRNLQVSGNEALASFRLYAAAGVRGRPSQHSYLIRFTNTDGHENPQPVRYAINVLPDRGPEVRILDPAQREIQLPINRSLPILVWAKDRDFGLRSVEVVADTASRPEQPLFRETPRLLNEEIFEPFRGSFTFQPQGDHLNQQLKVGDTVRIRAMARDNRQRADGTPFPNVEPSAPLVVKIVTADQASPKDDQGAKSKEKPGGADSKSPMQKSGADKKKPDGKKPQKKEDKKQGKGDGAGGNAGGNAGGKEKPKEKKGEGGGGFDQDTFRKLHQQAEKKQGGAGSQENSKNPGGSGNTGKAKEKSRDQTTPQGTGGEPGAGNKENPKGPGSVSPKEGANKQPGTVTGKEQPKTGTPMGGVDSKKRFPGKAKEGETLIPNKSKSPSNPGDPKSKGKEIDPKKSKNVGLKSNPDPNPMAQPGAKGEGTATRGNPGDKKPKEKIDPKESKITPKGGNPKDKQGSPGSGDGTKDPSPTPGRLSETDKVRNDKPQSEDGKTRPKPEEPDGTSINEKESDGKTKGNPGDRNGGGGRGGGQSGNKEGTGGGGQKSAAESGSGAAPGQGKGPTSRNPGGMKEADGQTGTPGQKSGKGSTARKGNSSSGNSKTPGGKSPPDNGPNRKSGSSSGGNNDDPRGQGFDGGHGNTKEQPQVPGQKDRPSDPDLESAKKAIDLVLEYLKDHPDEAGFSEPQRLRWMEHLEKMRQRAGQDNFDGVVARNQLRNLGSKLSTGNRQRDAGFQLNEGYGSAGLDRYPDADYFGRPGGRPSRKERSR